jgi:hypothetical protein
MENKKRPMGHRENIPTRMGLKFSFIEPTPPKNEKQKPQVRCNICSWKLGKPFTF